MTTLANQATRARSQNANPDPNPGPPVSQADFAVNRRVHAYNPVMEVVRYDRTSKWYLEPVGYPDLPRQKVTIDEAVQFAYDQCGSRCPHFGPSLVNLGLPGGTTFDRKHQALVNR